MKKQIPNWVFTLMVVIATGGALWAIGRATPSGPPQSPLTGHIADAGPTDRAQEGTASSSGASAGANPDAPMFKGKTVDGKTFDLSDYKGKVVLVNFWATWCGPCRMEIPDLIKLQEKYGPRGFTVVGISQDEDATPVPGFIEENKITYPILVSPPGLGQSYAVTALPTSFLIDKKGKVVWAMQGISPDKTTESVIAPEIEKAL